MKDQQYDYASQRPKMYDRKSREQKALQIVKTLTRILGNTALQKFTVLDIGCSTGIIDTILAQKCKKVVGIDIDKKAILFAKKNCKQKNLVFTIGDTMKLAFPNNSFDVIICAQVYEHVPNPQKLFEEVYRVLRPGGVCYLSACNKLWPIEPHYNLPFLSFLPTSFANYYIKITGKGERYFEKLKTYWQLKKLVKQFIITDVTTQILKEPKGFGFTESFIAKQPGHFLVGIFAPLGKFFAPTFFWLLGKPSL